MNISPLVEVFNNAPMLYVFLGIAALVVVLIVIGLRHEKKRSEELKKFSAMIGFSFSAKPEEDVLSALGNFNLFKGGRSRKAFNVSKGKWGRNPWAIFDYRYTVGGGRSSSTYTQTVASTQLDNMDLPAFTLGPEYFFHRIGDIFGFKDIDFGSHPVFSKKYLLKSSDEEAIRRLFSSWVLEFFQRMEKSVSVEAEGNRLIIFRANKRVKPNELQQFVMEAEQVLSMFKGSTG